MHSDRHIDEELRALLVEQATIRDEQKAATGSLRNFNDNGEGEAGSWVELSSGDLGMDRRRAGKSFQQKRKRQIKRKRERVLERKR